MKKFLLGSTALVAAGMIAGGTAQADDKPIGVTVGGYYQSAFAVVDQQSDTDELADAFSSTAMGQDVEINVFGESTFDNGLTAGFKAVIEGNLGDESSADEPSSFDERFVFFRGSFGQIRVGATESARQEFISWAPGGAGIFGVNTPFFIFGNPGNTSFYAVRTYNDGLGSEDSMKMVYFSPSFSGISFALSYAPSDGGQDQYGANTREVTSQLLDQMSAAAAFDHTVGDIKIHVSAGYETYNLDKCAAALTSQNCEDSPTSMNTGGTVSFGKFSVGGGYLDADIITNGTPATGAIGPGRSRTDMDVGVSYWDATWGVGLQYGNAEIDGTTASTADDLSFNIIALNGTYILGPGVSVQGQIDRGTFDDATAGNDDNDYTSFMVGSSLSF